MESSKEALSTLPGTEADTVTTQIYKAAMVLVIIFIVLSAHTLHCWVAVGILSSSFPLLCHSHLWLPQLVRPLSAELREGERVWALRGQSVKSQTLQQVSMWVRSQV